MLGIADATLGTHPLISSVNVRDEYGLRIQSFGRNWQLQGHPRSLTEITYDRIIMDQLRSPAGPAELQRLGNALLPTQSRNDFDNHTTARPRTRIEAG